jgi:hypothetical protein
MSDETPITKKVEHRAAGYLAEYDTPAAVLHAAEKVRDAGYSNWDVHTPFPIHGMDGAMGLRATPLGFISLCGGITGGSLALLMQWWMNGYDYPINIAGKPAFAVQAFVPVTFELTILLTAFATLFGMLGLNQLPTFYHWVFGGKRFGRATDDRFFISIAAEDPKFDEESTKKLLDKTHPISLEKVDEEIEVVGRSGRETAGLVVEAIAGISSPFKDEKKSEHK